jgi:hypothetical protein
VKARDKEGDCEQGMNEEQEQENKEYVWDRARQEEEPGT